MTLVNIGFGSMVAAPIKRIIQEAKDRGMLIDASYGRKTKSVLLMDTDHVILSAVSPETLTDRWQGKETEEEGET